MTAPSAPQAEREYLPGYQPSEQVENAEWRSYEDYQQGYTQPSYVEPPYVEPSYVGPAYYDYEDSAPSFVEPQPEVLPPPPPPMVQRPGIAPIQAPPNKLLFGAALFDRPWFVPEREGQQLSNTMSAIQADGGNFVTSLGVPTKQADRLVAGAVTGAALGGVGTAIAVGAPMAVLGGAAGAMVGTVVGVAVGSTLASVFIPGVGIVVGPVIGGVNGLWIGGAAGAAALGIPAAMAGFIVGAVAGGIVGATAFGGEDVVIEEPALTPAPEAPALAPLWIPSVVDAQAVTGQTQQVIEQVEAVPGGTEVVEQVREYTEAAPEYAAQTQQTFSESTSAVREAALAQPGGDQLVASVEQARADAAAAAAPVIEQAGAAWNAFTAGLNA
ncbi:hypothetical protein ACNJ7E_43610 [Rhodococcus sp. NM-2]|uniref:hypothetical protein n=1 Tax=Rhodococcus sp. NM-2 TaxID=3401174 RepID=UPI003AAE6155